MVPHHGAGRIEAFPAGDARPQSQFGVVGVCEEILVEAANPVQHGSAVHGGAAVGPQDLFDTIELAAVQCARTPALVLPVGIDQVPHLVDAARILVDQDLGSRHADLGMSLENAAERREPVRIGFRVVVEQGNELAPCGGDALVVGGAKAAVLRVADHARAELLFGHFGRAVARAVVHHHDLVGAVTLAAERAQAGAQQIPAIPVDDYDGDQGYQAGPPAPAAAASVLRATVWRKPNSFNVVL